MKTLRAGSCNQKPPYPLIWHDYQLVLLTEKQSRHKGSMAASALDGQIRQIWNIQICQLDLEPLLPEGKMKLPSTTINAFAVHLQNVLDDNPGLIEGDRPSIFSSWLGPLATGEINDGGMEGSFQVHVFAAVSRHLISPRITN